MREKIRKNEYIMTLHAEEEMSDDGLSIYDVERCILTGAVIERQKDRLTSERKYRVKGKSVSGNNIEVIVKTGMSGKLVIITVYAL
ncbi:MAG: DUF4258 domain-containing protein [Planctomycetota bacterium]|nr:MAG: DUF4258 domain-containing protein [Planctomycetota bacterium]